MSTKHLFFDLDNTLWDFEANSKEVITELFQEQKIEDKCNIAIETFLTTYYQVNDELWKQYRNDEITKEQLRSSRFHNTLLSFNFENSKIADYLEQEYIRRSPYRKNLIEGAEKILLELNRKYKIHIITNGFAEVQHVKLKNCGLDKYLDQVFISEEVGFNKPDSRIFKHALTKTHALAEESFMIGDDFHADIEGGLAAGMQVIHFNRKEVVEHKPAGYIAVTYLSELKNYL